MKKLISIGLMAAFMLACTAPEISEEITEYGTDKDKSVTRTGDGSEYDLDNSED